MMLERAPIRPSALLAELAELALIVARREEGRAADLLLALVATDPEDCRTLVAAARRLQEARASRS